MGRYLSLILGSVLIFGVLFGAVILVSSRQANAPTLPFLGRISLGGSDDEARLTNTLTLESVYGYRPSPQYYNAQLDTVEIRALVVNEANEVTTGQFETKIYKISELWDTKTHEVSYAERTDYIEAQPRNEIMAFSEEQLANIIYSHDRCGDDMPCYHDTNPDDGDNPYGGVIWEDKPVFVNISEELTLEKNGRAVYTASWTPEQCGYFMVKVQQFGYQDENGEDPNVKVAFVRTRGCEDGRILENGMVSGVATTGDSLGTDILPGTSAGFLAFVVPGLGLIVGGVLMHLGTRGYRFY